MIRDEKLKIIFFKERGRSLKLSHLLGVDRRSLIAGTAFNGTLFQINELIEGRSCLEGKLVI